MTADGSPACTPAPSVGAPDRFDDGIGRALVAALGRRGLMRAAAGGVGALLLAACSTGQRLGSTSGGASSGTAGGAAAGGGTTTAGSAASSTASAGAAATGSSSATGAGTAAGAGSAGGASWVYVFNVGSQDVSIIDAATHKVLATRPLGAAVRWLSNEQRYWDGQRIWTYDFPNNALQAIAIDPKDVKVVQRVDTGTKGPGHSLMLTPDKGTALVNAAGSNVVNVIDVGKGQVVDKIETGHFP